MIEEVLGMIDVRPHVALSIHAHGSARLTITETHVVSESCHEHWRYKILIGKVDANEADRQEITLYSDKQIPPQDWVPGNE